MNIGPKIHKDNLVLCYDASSTRSTLRTHQRNNILPDPGAWVTGTGGSSGYGGNGSSTEQLRVLVGDDPWDRNSVVWRTTPDATSGADGGWNSSYYPVDVQYTYRYSVWVRRHTSGTGGTFYMGMNPNPIRNDNNSSQGNPYFTYPSIASLTQNVWYLVVAHVFYAGYNGKRHPKSGWYENGIKISDKSYGNVGTEDSRWSDTTTSARHRAYHYYTTNTASGIEFAYPRIDKVDGNEPTIEQMLFRGESGVHNLITDSTNSVITPNNSGSYGKLVDDYRQLNWFEMDGTDDYISLPSTIQKTPSQSWTVEIVFNPWDQSDTSWNGIFGGNLSYGGYWMFHSSGNLTYYEGSTAAVGTQITYTSLTKSSHFTAGKFHHLTISYSSTGTNTGTYNIYLNGEDFTTFNKTFSFGYSLGLHSIGRGDGNRYGTNNVASFKLWDEDLTESQISGNYEAHKNRFDMGTYPV
jgi:hypothetical protein